MKNIKLGDRVKDTISGLKGIVTGTAEFLYGCRRVTIQPETNKDGKPAESFWIDEAQAELIKANAIPAYIPTKTTAPAGPRADHSARSDAKR